MNKKGDEPLKNTTISSVILVLTLVLIGIIALKFMAFGAQQCPAGFEEINPPFDSEVDTICRHTIDNEDLNCCRRKTNINEIYIWDFKNKEVAREVDLAGFERLYGISRTCKDITPCGTVKGSGVDVCAGVFCDENELCLISIIEGERIGKCVDELEVAIGGNTFKLNVFSDDQLLCGKTRDNLIGTACSSAEKELGLTHCIYDISKGARCTGTI